MLQNKTAVDARHHLIMENELTTTIDRDQLTLMTEQAQKTLEGIGILNLRSRCKTASKRHIYHY